MVREYLYCALRDKYQADVAQVEASYANINATYMAHVDNLNETTHLMRLAYESQIAAMEDTFAARVETIEATHAQRVASMEQQMRALRCPNPPALAHTVVTGDYSYGGDGLTYTCREGFAHDGDADSTMTSISLTCSDSGTWETTGGGLLNCVLINPCTAEEDDCDPLATCAHTGVGTHTCECLEGTAFGTGQWCSPCSASSCGVGQIQTATCTSTSDIACEAVQATAPLPEMPGAELRYSNGFSYPTTGTYTCGGQSMSRSLLPNGEWEAPGELNCLPPPAGLDNLVAIYTANDLTQTTGAWPDGLSRGPSAELAGSGGTLVMNNGQNGASGQFQVLRGTPATQFRTASGLWGTFSVLD